MDSRSFRIFTALIYVISSVLAEQSEIHPHRLRSPCTIKDYRGSSGICKLVQNCEAVLSDLRAGINPTLCNTALRRTVVCCPNKPRISEKKCEAYREILRVPKFSATPLLPLDELEEDIYKETSIKCEVYGNGLIVGGRNAKEEEFPHMVALGWGDDPETLEYKCGGALISHNFVLSVGHCVTSRTKPTHVLVGDIRLKPPFNFRRSIIKIAELIVHPYYRKPIKYNDIALIRLESNVTFSRAVRPACLPQPKLRLDKRRAFHATGWGKIGFDDASDILQAVNLTRFGQKECDGYFNNEAERKLKYPRGIIRSQVCAGDKGFGKDTCQGDSGGPLTVTDEELPCQHFLAGLTSFGGLPCGFTPGVYTNVQSFLPWIERNVWPNESI